MNRTGPKETQREAKPSSGPKYQKLIKNFKSEVQTEEPCPRSALSEVKCMIDKKTHNSRPVILLNHSDNICRRLIRLGVRYTSIHHGERVLPGYVTSGPT